MVQTAPKKDVRTPSGLEAEIPELTRHDQHLEQVIAELTRARDEARHAGQEVVTQLDRERRRLARELMAETGQWIASVSAGLGTLEQQRACEKERGRLARLRGQSEVALHEIRRMARGLHPSILDSDGLAAALERLTDDCSSLGTCDLGLQVVGLGQRERLPAEIEVTVYRVAQVALTAITRDASAKRASVVLERLSDRLRLIVEDDGEDREPTATGADAEDAPGHCVSAMRARVTLLGGTFRIESAAGEGTTVVVELPLAE